MSANPSSSSARKVNFRRFRKADTPTASKCQPLIGSMQRLGGKDVRKSNYIHESESMKMFMTRQDGLYHVHTHLRVTNPFKVS